MVPPEQSGAAPNNGQDQPYSVVPGPPGKLHFTRTSAPAPSPPASAPVGEEFFSKAVNITAVSVACAAAAALLILFVLQLNLRRRRLAARRRRDAAAEGWTPQLKEQLDSCVVEFTPGVLVQHPDKQLCCGFQTPAPSPGSVGPSLDSPPPWLTATEGSKDQRGLEQPGSPAGPSLAVAELVEGTKEQQPAEGTEEQQSAEGTEQQQLELRREPSDTERPGRVSRSSLVRQLLLPRQSCDGAPPQDSSPV